MAANRMRAEFGLAALPVARVASFVGKGADVLVHRALTDAIDGTVDEATYARGRAAFFRHYHAVNGDAAVLFEGARAALAALRGADLRIACVTNKAREFTVPCSSACRSPTASMPWSPATMCARRSRIRLSCSRPARNSASRRRRLP